MKKHTAIAPAKGRKKETAPIEMLAFQCRRSETGSISAPARKVSSTDPTDERNVVNDVCWTKLETKGMLPAATPIAISTRATATPARMLITEASSARAIHTAAIVYTLMPAHLSLVEAISRALSVGRLAIQGAGPIAPPLKDT